MNQIQIQMHARLNCRELHALEHCWHQMQIVVIRMVEIQVAVHRLQNSGVNDADGRVDDARARSNQARHK